MIFTFFILLLFLIIHVDFQQPDEHSEQDAKKLQVGAGFPHLIEDKQIIPVMSH